MLAYCEQFNFTDAAKDYALGLTAEFLAKQSTRGMSRLAVVAAIIYTAIEANRLCYTLQDVLSIELPKKKKVLAVCQIIQTKCMGSSVQATSIDCIIRRWCA